MTRLFYKIFLLKQNNAKIEKLSKKRNKHETKKVFFPSHCENKKIIIKSLYNMIDYFLHYIYNSDSSDSSDHYYRCIINIIIGLTKLLLLIFHHFFVFFLRFSDFIKFKFTLNFCNYLFGSVALFYFILKGIK